MSTYVKNMVDILYTFDRRFMRKTFEAIDRHVDAESAYLPLREEARGSCESIREIRPDGGAPEDIDRTVREVDPDVVVENHRFEPDRLAFNREYPIVHVRHGSSIGRGEERKTTRDLGAFLDAALAPGERWAEHYRDAFPDRVHVAVVGIPEADDLVGSDPPRERRVLYAPTNHNYGGGSYLGTAEHVLDVFADSEYELLFRPHPMDRAEEPGKSLTERCRERIADLPNVVFDEAGTPRESMLASDVLISDYSGIVAEWLHTGRPLIQLTDVAADREVPELGYATDRLSLSVVDDLYERGYPPDVEDRLDRRLSELGIPMDGRAGARIAREVAACTQ
jgi:hypothetical protein